MVQLARAVGEILNVSMLRLLVVDLTSSELQILLGIKINDHRNSQMVPRTSCLDSELNLFLLQLKPEVTESTTRLT